MRTYRWRPEWRHLKPSSLQYRRQKELGGTLMLTRYADDWVAVWNGSRDHAEVIKTEIKTFLTQDLRTATRFPCSVIAKLQHIVVGVPQKHTFCVSPVTEELKLRLGLDHRSGQQVSFRIAVDLSQ